MTNGFTNQFPRSLQFIPSPLSLIFHLEELGYSINRLFAAIRQSIFFPDQLSG